MTSHAVRFATAIASCAIVLTAATPLLGDGPAATQAQAEYEVRFMTAMIEHHAMAVEMSTICLSNAVTPELIATCQDIIAAQQQEIATMQTWLQQWYGVSYAPQMTEGMRQRLDRMAQMYGPEFEIAFMKSMIRHHWTAVVRASGCIERAHHPELVDMCANIIETQVAEITQMRTWLCEWYGVCNSGPKGAVAQTH